ncbi:hypothetical protein VTH82DRAFT_6146 [Thermothelomyces myriococcoides]
MNVRGMWQWSLPEVTPEQLLQEYHEYRDQEMILYNDVMDNNNSAEHLPHNLTRVVEGDMIPVSNHKAQQIAKRCADLYDKFVSSSGHNHNRHEDAQKDPVMNDSSDTRSMTNNVNNIDSNTASPKILHITVSDFIEFTTLFHNLSCLNQDNHAAHGFHNGHGNQNQSITQHNIASPSQGAKLPFLRDVNCPLGAHQTRSSPVQDELVTPLHNKNVLFSQQPAAASPQEQGIEHDDFPPHQPSPLPPPPPSPNHVAAITDTTTTTTASTSTTAREMTAAAAALETVLERVRAVRQAVETGIGGGGGYSDVGSMSTVAVAREGLRWLEGEVQRMLVGCCAAARHGDRDGDMDEDGDAMGKGKGKTRAQVRQQQLLLQDDDGGGEFETGAWLDLSKFA